MRIRFAAASAVICAASAFGQTFVESGDAPQLLPGQSTGSGPLTQIQGDATGGDVDMFAINIDNPAGFAAGVTVAGGTADTQLFLFDTSGHGVTFDDDAQVLSRRFGLRSLMLGRNGAVPAAGLYYLAISGYDDDPVDSSGQEIWLDSPFDAQRAPDGPGAANALASWLPGLNPSGLTNYTIELRGASAAGGAPRPAPEPSTLIAATLGGLMFIRRRR